MASNLVSLAKAWNFHMSHRVNMFERGGKETKDGFVCVCVSPPLPWQPAAVSLQTLAQDCIHTKCTARCTVALIEGRRQSMFQLTHFISDFNNTIIISSIHFYLLHFPYLNTACISLQI